MEVTRAKTEEVVDLGYKIWSKTGGTEQPTDKLTGDSQTYNI